MLCSAERLGLNLMFGDTLCVRGRKLQRRRALGSCQVCRHHGQRVGAAGDLSSCFSCGVLAFKEHRPQRLEGV